MLREPRERCPVDNIDCPARHFEPASAGEFVELPADNLPRAAELVGKVLVRCVDVSLRAGKLDQLLRQSDVDAREGDFLDDAKQVGDAATEGGKDELAEFPRTGDQLVEQRARDRDCPDLGFGYSFGLVFLVAHQAGRGQRAALAGLDAVKHDLAARLRCLLNANRSFEQEQERLRRLAGPEDPAVFGQLDDQARVTQLDEDVARQLPDRREGVRPVLVRRHGRIRASGRPT